MAPWSPRKLVCAALLALVAAASFLYAYREYALHKEEIVIQVADAFEAIALPFRVAKLTSEPADTKLRLPVEGVRLRDVSDTWGAARSSGRTHEGVDIFAARGTPVYAATRGFVVRVGENNLGGTIVFTIGAGGVRYYYAHLDRVAEGIRVGMPVTSDTVIGFVGNTGNAEGTAPHLHFGMYVRGAQNPYPLLIDR